LHPWVFFFLLDNPFFSLSGSRPRDINPSLSFTSALQKRESEQYPSPKTSTRSTLAEALADPDH